jgi:hypothetical protein
MFINTSVFVFAQDQNIVFADQDFIVNADWFSATPIEYNGEPLEEGNRKDTLVIVEGGEGMQDFVDHGEIGYDEDEDAHVYLAEMVFPFSIALYTDADIEDVYTWTSNRESFEWLELRTYLNVYDDNPHKENYKVRWNTIGVSNFDSNEYNGAIKMTTAIQPNLAVQKGDTITMKGAEFTIPDLEIFTSKVVVTERTYGVCDDAQNFYSSEQAPTPIKKQDLPDSFASTVGRSDAGGECGDGYNDATENEQRAKPLLLDAGIHKRQIIRGVTYTTGGLGQGFASAPPKGTTWGFTDDQNDDKDTFDFFIPIKLRPNSFYDIETFNIRHKKLWVDRHKEAWYEALVGFRHGVFDTADEYTEKVKRTIGLGVQNIFLKMSMEAHVSILMSVHPEGVESESVLEDPENYASDILWDNTIWGQTEAQVTITEGEDLLDLFGLPDLFGGLFGEVGAWLTLALIGIAIIIVIFIIIKLLGKRKKASEKGTKSIVNVFTGKSDK